MAEAKYPAKTTYGRKGLFGVHDLRVQSLMVGEPWHREHEPASHIASIAKKHQVINSGTQLAFSFYPVINPSPGDGAVHIQCGSSRSN